MIVDLRNEVDYNRKHLPNSINIPEARVKNSIEKLKVYDKVVFACLSGTKARKMAYKYKNVLNNVTSINLSL